MNEGYFSIPIVAMSLMGQLGWVAGSTVAWKGGKQTVLMSGATVLVKFTPKANWGKISKQREILSPATKLQCSAEGKQVDKAVRGGEALLSALKLETCLQTWQAWHAATVVTTY